jgi:hypothetical protein
MLGSLGLSGNLAGLSSGLRARVADHVAFYKRHRAFIQSAVGIPLTPVEPLECRDGLAAVQLADPEFRRSLLLLFNLATHPRSPTRLIVRPAGLARRTTYALADDHDRPVGSPLAGSDVMDRGIDLECPRGDARMWWFTQAPQSPKTDSMGLA